MDLELIYFVPPDLTPEVAGFLVFCSAATSMLSVVAGAGGGPLLFAIMAWTMPLAALIPVHGVVQIGSSAGRLLIMLRQVRLTIFLPFFAGSLIGGALGALVTVQLPLTAIQIFIGCFILCTAWLKPPKFTVDRRAITLSGCVISFMSMLFGATGPLISAVLKLLNLDRLSHVATRSACAVAQHGIKVAAFGMLGFVFAPYLPLIVVMIGAGCVGTAIGNIFLIKIDDQRFHTMLSCVLTILALGLVTKGASTLIMTPDRSQTSIAASMFDRAGPSDQSTNRAVIQDGKHVPALGYPESRRANLVATNDDLLDTREPIAGHDRADGSVVDEIGNLSQQRQLAALKAKNMRLMNELEATRAALMVIDNRAINSQKERDSLAAISERDRQRITALENELKVHRERTQRVGGQVSQPQPLYRSWSG